MKNLKGLLVVAALLAVPALSARAQLIDLSDFVNGFANTSNATTVDDYLLTPSSGSTVNFTFGTNGVAQSLENVNGGAAGSVTSNFSITGDSSTGDGTILSDPGLYQWYGLSAFTSPSTATIDFSGLADSQTYEILIYTRNQNGANGRTFVVSNDTSMSDDTIKDMNGNTESGVSLYDQDNDGFLTKADTTEQFNAETFDGNYLEIFAETDGSGNLDLSLQNPNGGEFDVSGLQLVATPEPSLASLLALGIGALFFVAYRRRANQSV